jgi:spore germination protein KC
MKPVVRIGYLLLCMVLLTGCWNRRELNELALVLGMSVDLVDGQYLVTVQVVDPGEVAANQGGGGRTPVSVFSERGDHIFSAIRKITTSAPRKMYFAHLQMFVISEEVAKKGINPTLELLTRDPEFRKDFYIVVSKDVPAKDIMQNITTIEKIPANKMHESLETSEKAWAPTVAVRLDELVAFLTGDGINAVLTGITFIGKDEKRKTLDNVTRTKPYGILKYTDIAIFREDRLVGWLDETESKGYNYIRGNVKNTVGAVPCSKNASKEEELIIETIRTDVKVKGKVKNGKPEVDVTLNAESNVGEVSCKIDLTKPETIKMLEETTSKRSEEVLIASVKKAQEYKSDIFGFGDAIHRADPKAWKKLKKNWNEEFANMTVNIKSNYTIRRTGTINRNFMEETKEE